MCSLICLQLQEITTTNYIYVCVGLYMFISNCIAFLLLWLLLFMYFFIPYGSRKLPKCCALLFAIAHTHTHTVSLTYSESLHSLSALRLHALNLFLAPFALTDCVFVQLLTSRLWVRNRLKSDLRALLYFHVFTFIVSRLSRVPFNIWDLPSI